MNDSKTYTISEDLYKAILESIFVKGQTSGKFDLTSTYLMDDAIKGAIEMVQNQQYIYED